MNRALLAIGILAFVLAALLTGEGEHGIRAALAGAGVVLVLLAQVGPQRARPIAVALLVAWGGGVLGWNVGRPVMGLPSGDSVQVWSVFHYVLGPKYFPEVGYTDLYEQALAADDGRRWRHVTKTRDLRTYEVERVDRSKLARSEAWTPERWEAFQHDIGVLQPYTTTSGWRRILRDRGYNAPPPATVVRRGLTAFELNPARLSWLGGLDPLVLFLAFAAVGWAFGPLRALVAAAWLALFFGNAGDRLVGVPFLYDYLAVLLLAACAIRKDRPALGGALLGYAAMVRIFPALLIVGVGWWALFHQRRSGGVPRVAARLLAGFAWSCAVLFALGFANGRGMDGWREFGDNISLHAEQHRIGERRIGLAHLATVDWTAPIDDQSRSERRETFALQEGLWLGAAGVIAVLWLWGTARSRLDLLDVLVTGLVLVFAGLVLSRYYASAACLLFLVSARQRDGPLGARAVAWVGAALLAWVTLFELFALLGRDDVEEYLFANGLCAVGVVAGLLLLARRKAPAQIDRPVPARPETVRWATAGAIALLALTLAVVLGPGEEPAPAPEMAAALEEAPPAIDPASPEDLRQAIALGAEYLNGHIDDEGQFAYRIDIHGATPEPRYNVLRHGGTVYALAQYHQRWPDPATARTIGLAARYLREHHLRPAPQEPGMYMMVSLPGEEVDDIPEVKLGGCGLGLIALLRARELDPEAVTLDELRGLGRFILFMQREDGSFHSKWAEERGFLPFESLYYPGEAILALTLLYQVDPDQRWLRAAAHAVAYLVDSRKGQRDVPNDHWLMIAASHLLPIYAELDDPPVTAEEIRQHIIVLGESMMEEQRDAERGLGVLGAFNRTEKSSPAATRIEGLVALHSLLLEDETELRESVEHSIRAGNAWLLTCQVTEGVGKGGFLRARKQIPGEPGSFNRRQTEVRIDYVQHAMSALMGDLDIRESP